MGGVELLGAGRVDVGAGPVADGGLRGRGRRPGRWRRSRDRGDRRLGSGLGTDPPIRLRAATRANSRAGDG